MNNIQKLATHDNRNCKLFADTVISLMSSQGFYGRQVTRDEQKELMALWFCRSPAGEPLPDRDGGLAEEKDFLDLIAPAAVQFQRDHYLFGDTYRCACALRGYPTATEAQALLRFLGERGSVTVHIYTRHVTPFEEDAILTGAANRNRLEQVLHRQRIDNLLIVVAPDAGDGVRLFVVAAQLGGDLFVRHPNAGGDAQL